MQENEIPVNGNNPIFAVDDDPMFHEILEFAYQLSGLPNPYVKINSGYDCLEVLGKIDQEGEEFPSVIVMDINMPGLNGIETVERIRSDPRFKDIPVITMLSSSNEEGDISRALEAGANAYCEKPFDITQLKFVQH